MWFRMRLYFFRALWAVHFGKDLWCQRLWSLVFLMQARSKIVSLAHPQSCIFSSKFSRFLSDLLHQEIHKIQIYQYVQVSKVQRQLNQVYLWLRLQKLQNVPPHRLGSTGTSLQSCRWLNSNPLFSVLKNQTRQRIKLTVFIAMRVQTVLLHFAQMLLCIYLEVLVLSHL